MALLSILILTAKSSTSSITPQMALPTLKPHKRLAEFLNDEQEPFILELYLSEREYSNRWSSIDGGDSTNTSEQPKKKGFFYVLKALYKKLSYPKETESFLSNVHEYDQRNKHEGVLQHTRLDHILQFSSDTRFTMLSSCQDIGEDGTSLFSHKQQHLFYSRTLYNMVPQQRRQPQRFIEGGYELQRKIHVPRAPDVIEDVRRTQQRIQSSGDILPKKIRGKSLLSAAGRWGGLVEETKKKGNCGSTRVVLRGTDDVSQKLKSKRVLRRIMKMLFDCVKDIAITLPTEDDRKRGYRQFMGTLQIGKLLRQRTNKWDQQAVAVGGANLTYLLTLDYLNSIVEWKKFEPHVKDISIEITDAILDDILNEIVIEITATSIPNT
ncbi:uncharacterized protein LOC106764272 isoform X2 [Vigna radiata var. radiata]|uniref:Uncharacterized protein LOC106764272 isoform X2 n=1 Tax=Vigna radiata var. radiata TaxID=3916 RepID=A0A1S3UDC1_VIGRR|nr:uncharacterized protein LOC106764272 isoform X2 [Vigna radiata var. radiata]